MTTMISSLLTMHRKLDLDFVSPEIPLVNEWNVMGQKTGTMLRSTAAYVNAGAGASLSVTVEFDEAVGDVPFPLSGTLRVINAADGVVAAGDGIWDDIATGRSGLTCSHLPQVPVRWVRITRWDQSLSLIPLSMAFLKTAALLHRPTTITSLALCGN